MLSLVIPVRDRPADQIGACIGSFLRLKSKALDEIVVVDFGSTEAIGKLASDKRVRVVRVEARQWNLAEAINAGVAASRNPIVAKVDAAIVIAAESGPALDALAASCRRTGETVVVQTIDLADGVDAKTAFATPTTELLRRGRPRARGGETGLGVFPVEIWNEVGGFDARCDGWDEADIDFAGRVRRSGHKVRRMPTNEIRIFHVGASSRDAATDTDHAHSRTRKALSQDRSAHRSIALPAARTDRVAAPNIISSPRPLVTVAIASTPRNGRDWTLAGAIRGFAGQIDNDFEILIANSGPADEVATGLRRAMGPVGEALAIRAFDIGEASIAAARNRLTDEARGRYVCVADDDAIALPNRLADHLRCFEKEPGIHGSHGGWIDVDQSYRVIDFNAGGSRTLEALLFAPAKVTAHAASLFRKDVLQAIRHDEAAPAASDHDLALRMANLGCRVAHTRSYVTVRRSQGDNVDAESLASQRTADEEARQRVGESLGNLYAQRLGEQAKAAEPAACGNGLTKEQVIELIDSCSGPERKPGEPATYAVARHPRGMPLVSIVIPCFNYGRFVRDAVASAKAQTFENIEIIVVEGGSTDGETPGIVAGLEDGTVRIFYRNERHRGGSNRNYGIERARGTYICCLDADDMLAPTYIEKAVFLMEHYGYDVVSCGVQQFGQETTRYGVAEKVDLQILLNHNQMATCGVFRKALWQASGGYTDHGDGSASTHIHDDWQFWVRLAAHGARFFNMERDHLFLYRIHGATSVSRRPGIQSREWQRRRIRELNSKLITDAAIERSIGLRRIPFKAGDPLINLAPASRAPATKSIVVAMPYMVLGGAERLLSTVLKHLTQDGWDISIVTTLPANATDGDSEEWFAPATSRIYHLPKFLSPDRWDDFLDYLIVSRRAGRLLIAGSAYAYEQLPSLKSRHRHVKVFDLLFNTAGHTKNNRQASQYLDGNIVENAEVRDWLLDNGERRERIATIPSGVNLAALPAPVDRSLRKSFDAKAGDIVVGFSGRWSPEKNPIGFIEIAEHLADDRRIHFVMTGAGRLADDIARRLAAAPALAGRFHLLGNVANLDSVLTAMDILVLPSIVDGRPVVILEALASGVPVVASKVGGVPELVLPGMNGELCPPGEVSAFAEAIAGLAADRKRLARYKVGARSFAEKYLDERQMLDRYLEVLRSGRCAPLRPVRAANGAGKHRAAARRPEKHTGPAPKTAVNGASRHRQRVSP